MFGLDLASSLINTGSLFKNLSRLGSYVRDKFQGKPALLNPARGSSIQESIKQYNANPASVPQPRPAPTRPAAPSLASSIGSSRDYQTTSTSQGQADVSSSAMTSQQNVIQTLTNSLQKMQDTYKQKAGEFDAKNPFSLDELMAAKRKEVGARLDPYYTQTLNDLIRGVEVKRTRSLEDERQVLADLSSDVQHYTEKSKDILDQAIQQSSEGKADSGLFFSGAKMQTEGQLTAKSQENLGETLTKANRLGGRTALEAGRTRSDLGTALGTDTRNLKQERYYQTESQATNEAKVAEARRNLERDQYIGSPFSSGSLSSFISSQS